MPPNSSLAIIIINWKMYDLTNYCIQSVLKSSYKYFKIILIDNECKKPEFFEKNKKIHIIKNKNNEGFSKANNQGVKYALKNKYDYIMLLNNDTLVKDDLLELLIKKLNNSNYKIIQPLILNYDGSKIWNAGAKINKFFGIFYTPGKGLNFENFNQNKDETEWFTGCCAIFNSEIFNEVGLFDESFFAYYEDVDFSLRLKDNGYKIGLLNDSYLLHYESASSKSNNQKEGSLSPMVHYLNIRNHIIVLRKHLKYFNLLGATIFQFFKLFVYTLYFILRLRLYKLKMVYKGLYDSLKNKKYDSS